MHRPPLWLATAVATLLLLLFVANSAGARPPIRRAFFDAYPAAETTRLDELISNAKHCGACHLDFDGGGARNSYGLALQVAIDSGLYATDEAAVVAIGPDDSDNDGFSNETEILDFLNFGNTPTFPGLTAATLGDALNVDSAEITGHLTPSGGSDTTPPAVSVLSPSGGESYAAESTATVLWSASDASGISHVDIYFSDDDGAHFEQIAGQEPDDGSFDWFVPNLPGGASLIKVVARDSAGNFGEAESQTSFVISPTTRGRVPTTLRDLKMPGSQPFFGGNIEDPALTCAGCHANYDTAVEPWSNWKGSMMAHAMRDPLFLATMTIAEQDAPSSGDMCLRCHTPGGWLEGRSTDTFGGMLIEEDMQGVQCDFCHRLVDPVYDAGIDPGADLAVLSGLADVPTTPSNGNFVVDPDPVRRGPYADAQAAHAFLDSEFHRSSALCGTCHDVSNPVFVSAGGVGNYVADALDSEHPDGELRNMVPVERTYSEWTQSEYASAGVYAPQFAGNKADGMVSTCQDCHMPDVVGKASSVGGSPVRDDLGLHDLTGGNTFIPDVLPDFAPGEVNPVELAAGKARAIGMLQKAASMSLSTDQDNSNILATVRITNETGHKLPSGYPEGRRVWLQLKAYDENSQLIFESGAYDPTTGYLSHDPQLKIYEIEPGISHHMSSIVGLSAGPSFHFVLNDSIWFDNRIPPRGFTNEGFESIQAQPVAYSYEDGQYWDDTDYVLPATTRSLSTTLYYQTTSKEYVEFLRDENVTDTLGQQMYDLWEAHGRSAPVAMVSDSTTVDWIPTAAEPLPTYVTAIEANHPNPFNATTQISYELARRSLVRLVIYDVAGRKVRTLEDGWREAGPHALAWQGLDDGKDAVASGLYLARFEADGVDTTLRIVLVK